MMEKKFRVEIDGELIYVTLDEMLQDGEQYLDACYQFRGQFTGLKDMNGKDIYEGDIIKKPDFKTSKGKLIQPKAFEVVFENGGFHAKDGFHLSLATSEYEVIGNIYEK